jgi:hypothetical protein
MCQKHQQAPKQSVTIQKGEALTPQSERSRCNMTAPEDQHEIGEDYQDFCSDYLDYLGELFGKDPYHGSNFED